jgi:hypothetical protein
MDGSRYQYELSKSITQKGDEMVRSFKGGTRRRYKHKKKRYTYSKYASKYNRYRYKKQHKSRRRK